MKNVYQTSILFKALKRGNPPLKNFWTSIRWLSERVTSEVSPWSSAVIFCLLHQIKIYPQFLSIFHTLVGIYHKYKQFWMNTKLMNRSNYSIGDKGSITAQIRIGKFKRSYRQTCYKKISVIIVQKMSNVRVK